MAVATRGSRRLEIRLLGEPLFYADGALQNIRLPAKSLVLLSLLAFKAGKPLDRVKLAFTLWPDDAEDDAKAKMRRYLYLLGRAIAEAGDDSQLAATSTTLAWLTDGPNTIDVVDFVRLSSSPETLEAASALYAGDLLADIDDESLQEPRERLREQQLQNLVTLGARYHRSDPDRALEYANAALRIDPWREDAVRAIIHARIKLGDRAGAMQAYSEFERRLREEFGSEPDPETAQACQAAKTAESPSNNLPRQVNSFVGRDHVLAEIAPLFVKAPLVTLVGSGGVGKTRCAVQIGSRSIEAFDDGVWLAELAPTSDSSLVCGVIAKALNLQESPNRPLLDMLLGHLQRKRLLLILDNCEHVIKEVCRVAAAILRRCPDVRVLATSREPLNITGEQVFRMPSLDVPPGPVLRANDALSYGAARLFADRASTCDIRFSLTDENASNVAEICRRLDGIPLAIELAAARVKVLSPRQLARKLDERFRVLTGGDRSGLPRQQTMRALIDWSYDLLSSEERALFERVSIFAGSFSLESAVAVCAEEARDEIRVLDVLTSLVDKSLVQVESSGTETRYRLLESTREYGRDKLLTSGEYEAVATLHAKAFADLAERLGLAWEGVPDRDWLASIAPEFDNWRAALKWALLERNDVLPAQRLAAALRPAWWDIATAEGRRWIEAALDAVDPQTPPCVVARLEVAKALLDAALTQHKASYASALRALSCPELSSLDRIWAQGLAGRALLLLGKPDEGEVLLSGVFDIAREAGVSSGKAVALTHAVLSTARANAGDLAGARAHFADALALATANGAERALGLARGYLAKAEFREGNVEKALQLVQEALAGWRARNSTRNIAMDSCSLAAYLVASKRWDDARDVAREALWLARETEDHVQAIFALQHLAAIAALRSHENDGAAGEAYLRSARILGYVDARIAKLESTREYPEQQEYDKMLAALREGLGEGELLKALAQGTTRNEEQTVAEALLI
jgi:predicted ATPase/DNA-binding SARP family transcriptional activator